MTPVRRIAATVTIAGTLLAVAPADAIAGPSTGAQYGEHVRSCAQIIGFTGEHNPGMHRGYAGWDGMTCQSS